MLENINPAGHWHISHTDLIFKIPCISTDIFSIGPVLRGAFGKSLRQQACVKDRNAKCPVCELFNNCPYALVFEAHERKGDVPWTPGYVFEWDFANSGQMAVTLKLLGCLNDVGDVILKSLARMRLPVPDGSGFVEVDEIISTTRHKLNLSDAATPPKNVRVEIVTPLNLKQDGKQMRHIDLDVLVQTAQRRVDSVCLFYGDASCMGQGDKGSGQIINSNITMHNEHRFSFRQRQSHPLNGMLGQFEVTEPGGCLYALLKAAEVLHIGKGLSFGLGRIRVVEA
ncbi:MAG: CRISPR system precrRNA processing endoribonuclease RAMP protein Cas6 [Deltaproteobacteria bacterium]|nr:CRISPR system precrRNA processing endoribonuclease RAMP protein Cas6 [Deltaproteobacteria bacterium]